MIYLEEISSGSERHESRKLRTLETINLLGSRGNGGLLDNLLGLALG